MTATLVGTASSAAWYVRNPWGMEIFDGRLYIGSGNASNSAPSPNAGPTPVLSYAPSGGFITEATLQEQQISKFITIDDELIIPGQDRMTGTVASWYRLESGIWVQHQQFTDSLHCLDIRDMGGVWYAALGRNANNTMATSINQGTSWAFYKVPTAVTPNTYPIRSYEIFYVGTDIFINTSLYTVLEGATNVGYLGVTVSGSGFAPALPRGVITGNKLARPVRFLSRAVCLDVNIANDHQWIPNFPIIINTDYSVTRIAIPNADRIQDFKIDGSRLYALCNKINGSNWDVFIAATDDLVTWTTLLTLGTFAAFGRSFAIDDYGVVYLGLGGDTDASSTAQAQVGQIWTDILPPDVPAVNQFVVRVPPRDFVTAAPQRDFVVKVPPRDFVI